MFFSLVFFWVWHFSINSMEIPPSASYNSSTSQLPYTLSVTDTYGAPHYLMTLKNNNLFYAQRHIAQGNLCYSMYRIDTHLNSYFKDQRIYHYREGVIEPYAFPKAIKANSTNLFSAHNGHISVTDIATATHGSISKHTKDLEKRDDYIDCSDTYLLALTKASGATLYDLKSNTVINEKVFKTIYNMTLAAFSKNEEYIITIHNEGKVISLWDMKKLNKPISIESHVDIFDYKFSWMKDSKIQDVLPHSQPFVVGCKDGAILSYDLDNLRIKKHLIISPAINVWRPKIYALAQFETGIASLHETYLHPNKSSLSLVSPQTGKKIIYDLASNDNSTNQEHLCTAGKPRFMESHTEDIFIGDGNCITKYQVTTH